MAALNVSDFQIKFAIKIPWNPFPDNTAFVAKTCYRIFAVFDTISR
jgi:hypothetical protein